MSELRAVRRHSERWAPPKGAQLSLPATAESAEAFVLRLGDILTSPFTRVYVDTSFLMWMTRIGSQSRTELTRWLDDLCGFRVHVPVWAAHEYYRHHSEGTLINDLTKQLEVLENAASGVYAAIWPLLDEPLGSSATARSQQAQVRDALREVRTVAELAREWIPRYRTHAQDVVNFVNAHPLRDSKVPSYFESLDAIASTRFTGRIPPGFKDRNKPELRNEEEGGTESISGSNRWGDLVLWKEVLDDARHRRVQTLVLLTRDAKNDWRAAGSLPLGNAHDSGPSIAPTHPFLAFEAAVEAGVSEVLLVDQAKLAAVAKATAEETTRAFFLWRARQPFPRRRLRQSAARRNADVRCLRAKPSARPSLQRMAFASSTHLAFGSRCPP